ncbi:protein Red [Podospora australis]|uniref:Protein Red n=1 Tax=Podospora australis TaxID=1536484 RepID=A0AAN6WUE3_9PEZI|nr:protein Red [Podospora australis]
MNNQQFRNLLLANAAKSNADKQNGTSPPSSSRPASSGTPVALGSRQKSSIPMTPRSVGGGAGRVDFAKQLAERNSMAFQKTQKKFKTAAPKGSRFAEGYVDRAKQREQEEADERAEKLKNLEEAYKKEEIDRETYDRLRGEIAGGDLSSTHLVKGLDFKLLERVRKGEDVYNGKSKSPELEQIRVEEEEDPAQDEDPDDVLDQLEATEVKAKTREKVEKRGQIATTTLKPGQKRTRDQLLAELKAAREAAKAKQESSLGSKFKKIGVKKTPGTRIERDGKGREVMIITDEDGNEKRKVRKIDPKVLREEEEREAILLASRGVLGMEVPEVYKKQQEAELAAKAEEENKEISIFDDVGSDYDPLAGLEDSDSSSDEEEKEDGEIAEDNKSPVDPASKAMPPPPLPQKPAVAAPAARNYFKDSKTGLTSEETYKAPSLDDPSFVAALKKAKAAGALEKSEEERKTKEQEERLKKKIQELHRDDEDMDFGFGSSRVEDEADLEGGPKVKLSAWGEEDDDGEGGGGGGDGNGKGKRKRGGKKRKGDRNNFEDVMRVMERRKGGS